MRGSELEVQYRAWVDTVPASITDDVLWKVQAYRLALFIGHIGWGDVSALARDRRTAGLADQLYRALGSISANLAEGYSRSSGRDRARFLEYALGSARESREWYYKARYLLGDEATWNRLDLLTSIVRLLLTAIPGQRTASIRDDSAAYLTAGG